MHDSYIDENREQPAVVIMDDNCNSIVKFVITDTVHSLKYSTVTVQIFQNYIDSSFHSNVKFTFDSKDQALAVVKFFQEVTDRLYVEN